MKTNQLHQPGDKVKAFKRPALKKSDISFYSAENATATASAKHGLYGTPRKDGIGKYTRELHDGNSALCNRNYGISDDGDTFLNIADIPNEGLSGACRRCIEIYNKLL